MHINGEPEMQYRTEILDNATGELKIIYEDWVTVTELGKAFNLGARQTRQVLFEMGWLYQAAGTRRRLLKPEIVRKGYGRHIRPKVGNPFDVVSPEGQRVFASHLEDTLTKIKAEDTAPIEAARLQLQIFKNHRLSATMTTRMEVSWLKFYHPSLSGADIGRVLNISEQLVGYHLRAEHLQRLKLKNRQAVKLTRPVKPAIVELSPKLPVRLGLIPSPSPRLKLKVAA